MDEEAIVGIFFSPPGSSMVLPFLINQVTRKPRIIFIESKPASGNRPKLEQGPMIFTPMRDQNRQFFMSIKDKRPKPTVFYVDKRPKPPVF